MGMLGFFLADGSAKIKESHHFPTFSHDFPMVSGWQRQGFPPAPYISQRQQRQVCAADWSPSGLLSRVAEGSFHALIDTGETSGWRRILISSGNLT